MENVGAVQLFKDSLFEPNTERIAVGLCSVSSVYNKFLDGLSKLGITLMDWRYYLDGKAWLSKGEYKWTTPRGANKCTPIFWLSLWEGFFRVSFCFAQTLRDELIRLPISDKTKEIINSSQVSGKTIRWISVIIDVMDDTLLDDIYVLAEFRKVKMK